MQAAVKTGKNSESGSRLTGKPFFDKGGKDSFFSPKAHQEGSFFPSVQTKLTIGESGDKYEKEADSVADKVIQKLAVPGPQASAMPGIQRKCSECEKDDKISRKEKIASPFTSVQRSRDKDEGIINKLGDSEQEKPVKQDIRRKAALQASPFTAIRKPDKKEDDKILKKEDDKVLKKEDEKISARQENQIAKKEEETVSRKEEDMVHKMKDHDQDEKISKKEEEIKRSATANGPRIHKKATGAAQSPKNDFEKKLDSGKGTGSGLPFGIKGQMESAMGADLSGVRIHTGTKAAEMSQEINAQAFTHGNNIYFNEGKYDPSSSAGQHLLAHELTHTLQQGGGVRRKANADSSYAAADPAGVVNPHIHTPAPAIQRNILGDAWDATGGQLVDAAGEVLEFGETLFWEVVERIGGASLTATLREIQNQGVVGFFKGKLLGAINSIFDGLRNNEGTISIIFPKFGELLNRAQVIINALAAGDCQPLFTALEELKVIVTEMAGEAWDAITEYFQPAIDFFTEVWNSIALPAIEWLKNKAASIWEGIKQVAGFIWQGFKPVRDLVSAAWDWLQRMLGLNAEETGEEGLIQWAGRKVEQVWEEIKEMIRPLIEPARQIVAKISSFIPLGAILNLRQTINDWLAKVVATSTAMGADASNIQNEATQTSLRNQIIPAIQQSINGLKGSISQAAAWVNGQIGDICNTVTGFFATVRGIPVLSLATSAIDWLETKAIAIRDWCQTQVSALFDVLKSGLTYLSSFLTPIYDGLVKIFSALGDLLGKLPDFLLGPVWAMLPDCIKEPIKKFFLEQILGRLPFFQKLQAVENIWQKIQDMAIVALKQIFVDGDLGKAIWTFYSTMLDIIGIPPQLVMRVIAKGAQSLGDILADPLGFLGHFISALKLGLEQFFGNIGKHLLNGFQAWLLSKMEGTGIEMPQDISFMSMLKLAFQVLGITVDMLLKNLEEVTGKKGLKQKIERWIGVITNAWDWFQKVLEQSGEGGSIWDKLETAIGSIWDFVMDSVMSWLEETIVVKALAWIASKLDPTGVMAIITTIIDAFNVFQAIVEKAREILEMVERVLDDIGALIKGIIDKAALTLEAAMAAAIPVALAIMSALFGLDGVVDQVKEALQELRQKVEDGVKKIMQKIKGFVERLFGKGDEGDGVDTIDKALSEINSEAETEKDEGEVTKDEAEAIKNKVNQDHPSVIEISSVVDGGAHWELDYIQKKKAKISKGKLAKGPNQKKLGIVESGEAEASREIVCRSGTLDDRINGKIGDSMQAHHLISCSVAKESVFALAAGESGYDINRKGNGILLPSSRQKWEAIRKKSENKKGLPLHRGGHIQEYYSKVEALLNSAEAQAESVKGTDKALTDVQLVGEMATVEKAIESSLVNYELLLSNNDPSLNRANQ